MKYEERQTLFVNHELLGRVSNLALCQVLDETEFTALHCNRNWEVLGIAGGYKSLAAARSKVERSYHGVETKWVSTGYTKEDATSYLKELFKDDCCTFCGRNPLEVSAMVQAKTPIGDEVRICDQCVNEFYDFLHDEAAET